MARQTRPAIARQIAAWRQEVMDEVAGEVMAEECTMEGWANLVLAGWNARRTASGG